MYPLPTASHGASSLPLLGSLFFFTCFLGSSLPPRPPLLTVCSEWTCTAHRYSTSSTPTIPLQPFFAHPPVLPKTLVALFNLLFSIYPFFFFKIHSDVFIRALSNGHSKHGFLPCCWPAHLTQPHSGEHRERQGQGKLPAAA